MLRSNSEVRRFRVVLTLGFRMGCNTCSLSTQVPLFRPIRPPYSALFGTASIPGSATYADQHLSAPAIHEGAEGFPGPGKLGGALLEFKLFGFTSSNEVQQFLGRHRDDFTRQNLRPDFGSSCATAFMNGFGRFV